MVAIVSVNVPTCFLKASFSFVRTELSNKSAPGGVAGAGEVFETPSGTAWPAGEAVDGDVAAGLYGAAFGLESSTGGGAGFDCQSMGVLGAGCPC